MAEERLKTGLWVRAALRVAAGSGESGAILRRGDPDAGGVLVVLRGRDGLHVLSQTRDLQGALVWLRATGVAPVSDATADAYVERQLKVDPDLWVIEIDSPALTLPFEGRIID